MSYNQAFWFSLLLYMSAIAFNIFGAMAFVKYLSKRDQ